MMRRAWGAVLIALASAAVYLVAAYMRGVSGFPLDDAWIHQVYARNIATHHEFAFFAGEPSAGSTSPLWAILLSVGYMLHMDFRVWTNLLGAILAGLSAILLARVAERFSTSQRIAAYCALFAAFEWHLAWAAVSGMEIPLFVFLSLLLAERTYAGERSWILGLLSGLLVLTRPEGIVLAALLSVGMILDPGERGRPSTLSVGTDVFQKCMLFALGLGVAIIPYLALNLKTNGTLFPNTFYAKSMEYAVLTERVSFISRWAQLSAAPWVGAQILLLPGFVYLVVRLCIQRDLRRLLPTVWIIALPLLYAMRLPVTYQHARYEMPLVPFIILYGIWGTVELLANIKNSLLRKTWAVSTIATLIAFWLLGANAYSADVAFIDCDMVQTAHWVAANTPSDALVAAHDIGALGYYYDRSFIDLAGLVSPQVIPFIRDESRLRDYLFARQTAFVIVFPDWYDSLTRDSRFVPVYQPLCQVTRDLGGTDMVVFQIH